MLQATPPMTDLAGLIERLEGATGPDREIDVWLWALSEKVDLEWQGTTLVAGYHGVVGWCDPGKLSRNFRTNRDTRGPGSIPPFTASIDAAVTFAERVLPGCYIGVQQNKWPRDHERDRTWTACIDVHELDYYTESDAKTAPIALLIVALRALQAQGGAMADYFSGSVARNLP